MNKIFCVIGFFGSFFSPLGLLSYVGLSRFWLFRLSPLDIFFIGYSVSLLILKLLSEDTFLTLSTFRFYFGFLVFYLVFKSGVEFPIQKIFIFLLVIIPIEALLINTVISAKIMPNFPDAAASSHFVFSGYQRPYSFGGNASVSSVLLVVLYSILPNKTLLLRLGFFVSLALFASGLGAIAFCLLVLFRQLKIFAIAAAIFLPIILVFWQAVSSILNAVSYKLSVNYITYLIGYKWQQISGMFEGFSLVNYLFGNLQVLDSGYGGDFGWLYFSLGYGFFSIMLFVCFLLAKSNKQTIIPVSICLITSFHYPTAFFLSGQIVVGYLLAYPYKGNDIFFNKRTIL